MSSENIECNKDNANLIEYYNLFKRHVSDFKDGERILFIHIGNFDVLSKFISSNPNCSYFIIDQRLNCPLFNAYWPEAKCYESDEDGSIIKALESIDMKFDKIIMNPPYSKNLHLKILAKAIEKLDKDGTCVNLSPIRWLQDPLAKYKKNSDYKRFEDSVAKHIETIEIINKLDFHSIFTNETGKTREIGIYECKQKLTNFDMTFLIETPIKKVLLKGLSKPIFEIDKKDGIRVRLPIIVNEAGSGTNRKDVLPGIGKVLYFIDGKSKNGEIWYKSYATNQFSKKYTELIPNSIKFNSEQEAKNFCESYHHQDMKTIFPAYVTSKLKCDVNVTPDVILWMGDVVNPRTGKKGYESEWTDEDFYAYFGITDDEKKLIEETMEKYK